MLENNPFTDLPAALVEEVLNLSQGIGSELVQEFEDLRQKREERHRQLRATGLLNHESALEFITPTCAAVDGSNVAERLLAFDLTAAAAVAVEGLTPPSETRYWPDPRHLVHVAIEPHSAQSPSILRGLMMGMELSLARQAPHDVVLLDGSLTTPLIYFNQALTALSESSTEHIARLQIAQLLINQVSGFFEDYGAILEARRSDKHWVAVPKYTTRREIGSILNWPDSYDDRAMLTDILQPGEYTRPLQLQSPDQPWHINVDAVQSGAATIGHLVKTIIHRLNDIRIIYYRPNRNLPTFRLEMSRAVAETPGRLASVIYAIKHQCSSPAILEPFPLYMADRMVKKLGAAIPAFRQIITQSVSDGYQGNIADIFLNLHGYRTETGG